MTYRWLTDQETVEIVNPLLRLRRLAELSTLVAKVLGAFNEDGTLIECLTLQLMPLLGPVVRADNTVRDDGTVTRELAQRMGEFLLTENARGVMTIAESPFTQRLCERAGMKKLDMPVYYSDTSDVRIRRAS